jgi:hypothetical protein
MERNLSMAKKFAVLENNIVVNVVLCDDEASAVENFGSTPGFSVVEQTEATGPAGLHYTWDGEKFNYAEAPAEPTPEELVDDQSQN